MKVKKGYSLEDLLRPTKAICAGCGGVLEIRPYIWKGKIKTINWCEPCFKKSIVPNGKEKQNKDFC